MTAWSDRAGIERGRGRRKRALLSGWHQRLGFRNQAASSLEITNGAHQHSLAGEAGEGGERTEAQIRVNEVWRDHLDRLVVHRFRVRNMLATAACSGRTRDCRADRKQFA